MLRGRVEVVPGRGVFQHGKKFSCRLPPAGRYLHGFDDSWS